MALSETGQVVYTPVLSFLHQDQESLSTFLSLETKEGYTLVLTPHHLVFLAPDCGHDISEYQARFASRAKTGDCVLISTADSQTQPSRIVSVSVAESVGVYAPLTEAGTLFVDRVLVSSYALVEDHRLAHWAFGPLRLFYSLTELLWAEAADQTTTGPITLTNTKSHFSTLSIKKRIINEGFIHTQNNLTETFRVEIQAKRESEIHWYARLLYRFACVLLDSNLFYP
ncbi:Desert hedgehog protein [Oryzias melastigma]|uniref:Desert hedgehog protein n=1 Tax=Oryzias melastigma TaxID=30732 RepID=A0A834CBI7_ORYME|nr:Desert hedgehog protein [Oryzias melastigma]